jgi:hypothetical protein
MTNTIFCGSIEEETLAEAEKTLQSHLNNAQKHGRIESLSILLDTLQYIADNSNLKCC